MSLTYKTFDPPSEPFKVGDVVTIKDRAGKVFGPAKIASVDEDGILTECGRQWTKDGCYVGSGKTYPFPRIFKN